jgi:LysM domain
MTGRHATARRPLRRVVAAAAILAAAGAIAGTAATIRPAERPLAPVQAQYTRIVPGSGGLTVTTRLHHDRRGWVTVRAGQCLYLIAAAHRITWQQLYAANRRAVGPDPGLIHAGLRLRIPGVKHFYRATMQP